MRNCNEYQPHIDWSSDCVCVFCRILHEVCWPPLINAISERQRKIADGLNAAEKAKADLADAQAQVKQELDAAKAQAAQLIEQANRRAAQLIEEARTQAAAEGERIVNRLRSC